jgi:methylated-DNA-[protein]-cysteine S-methyltransferase
VYAPVDSPLGRLLLVQTEHGVCRVAFPEEREDEVLAQVAAAVGPRIVASRDATEAARDQLAAYLEGEGTRLDMPVDLSLVRTPFQLDVLRELHRVPRGGVVTYGGLAARAGHPSAIRATGTACGRNPIPIVVPCHRVLPAAGGVGNYGGGPHRKRALLELEGVLP